MKKGIANGTVEVTVSIDAGTKKTHKQIKMVDSYDKVIENLRRYSKAQKKYKKQVTTKYIIVPGINDNEQEIYAWLLLNKELEIKVTALDIDITWFHKNNNNIPKQICDLILFAKQKAQNLDLEMVFFDRACMVYNKIKKPKISYAKNFNDNENY